MPLWAFIYSAVLFLSAIFTIFLARNHSPVYILGELASGLFAVGFFMIHYGVFPYPPTLLTPLMMLAFILFQELWVNRELYDLLSLQHVPEQEQRRMLIVVPLTTILFLAPFVWVVLQVFKHYFSPSI